MHNAEFLIAHPLKHHIFPLASGITGANLSAILAIPLYKKGIAHVLSHFPGKIGRKASGYSYHFQELHKLEIYAPALWQVKRLQASSDRELAVFTGNFDKFIASKIEKDEFRFRTLVTMQDYMPETVAAAKAVGARIWTDQILNQSDAAIARIRRHAIAEGLPWTDSHDERKNSKILASADVVTGACDYTFEGLAHRFSANARQFKIPYGVDREVFAPQKKKKSKEIIIAARANSVRKGGHLFVRSLEQNWQKLLRLSGGRSIEIRIIGKVATEVKNLLSSAKFVNNILVKEYIVPYSDMPDLLRASDLFLMPSLSEGMSLLCIEAMSVALPVIITPYCGIDEFKDGEMGVGTLDTAESLGSAMTVAFEQMNMWPKWGQASVEATTDLTWKSYERKVADAAGSL